MTTGGTAFEQRDIVIIPFPFTDLSANKQRPALIISNSDFNRRNLDVVCCMITSHFESSADHVPIRDGDCEMGHLGKDSVIKPFRLFTVSKSRIIKKYNRLAVPRARTVIEELRKVIDLEEMNPRSSVTVPAY
jgi:mRNA interferase MazF